MARRPRVDSATSAVAIMAAAGRKIAVPAGVTLRKCDQAHWSALVADKPRSFWTDAKLAVAAQLARCLADIERIAAMDDGNDPAEAMATIGAINKLTTRQKTLRLMIDMTPASEGDKDERERREQIAEQVEAGVSGGGRASLLN